MNFGKVRPATDEDFKKLKEMIEEKVGWTLVFANKSHYVWTKENNISNFNMIKSRAHFEDISATTLYDVLHDPVYRREWDPTIIEGREICSLEANSDIGYYAMKLPKPLTNRDFLTLRSWRDLGREKTICNHSVNLASVPLRKAFVRGMSYITGYLIIADQSDSSIIGCTFYYVTQSDPKGNLPVWVVNKASQWLAPKVVVQLHTAALEYNSWKAKNNPGFKPWLHPEQIILPRVKSKDILKLEDDVSQDDVTFESLVKEEDVNQEEVNFDKDASSF